MYQKDEGINLDNFSIEEEIKKFQGEVEPDGWDVVLRVYVEPQVKNGLIIPDKVHDEQQITGCVGLVVAMAPGVYKDERYKNTGKWCQLGQWRLFPRFVGYTIYHDGIPLRILKEDQVGPKAADPRKINRFRG